jgi:hypothetical protein
MNSAAQIVLAHGAAPGAAGGGRTLSEGDTVFVRVLGAVEGSGAADGNHPMRRYEISFDGMRFFADSSRPLGKGDSFAAIVTFRNGKFVLVPAPQSGNAGVPSGGTPSAANIPPAIAAYLSSLGIPPDSLSLATVRFMQQFGFTFDAGTAARARKLARRFSGREEDAAEIAVYLLEKGIEADEEEIAQILDLHDGGGFRNRTEGRESRGESSEENTEESELLGLFEAKSLADAEGGLLTLANHIISSDRHWILLPFELSEHTRGIIRILLDVSKKTMEKAEIHARVMEKKFHFVLYYKLDSKKRGPSLPEIVFDGDSSDAGELSRICAEKGVRALVRAETPKPGFFTEGGDIFTLDAEA